MPESSHTPPSLCHSPSVSGGSYRRGSTPSTPLTTPTVEQSPWPPTLAPSKKDDDLYFSWHRKPAPENRTRTSLLTWNLTQHCAEPPFNYHAERELELDIDFPLFTASGLRDSSPRATVDTMATAAPVDISLPPRMSSNSQSPRNQTSNLTYALQEAQATGQPAPEPYNGRPPAAPEPGRLDVNGSGRQGSISNLLGSSYYNGTGAKPISVKDRNRRESNTAGSFMNGMSWGGLSVGSWVANE